MQQQRREHINSGFTLIELSIMLVVIGLIVGGILTGRDLINSSAVSAQIAQINKYNAAVGTFRAKYNGLPGDIVEPYATNDGFQPRGTLVGEGDGNGVIEGNCANSTTGNSGMQQGCGELAVFWQDLSKAGLIDAQISTGAIHTYPSINNNPWPNVTASTTPSISGWIPPAKLGNGQYVYVTSFNSMNYFVVQEVYQIGWDIETTGVLGTPGNAMTVQQAYNIDTKMDDGLPQAGNIIACASDFDANQSYQAWAAGSGKEGAGPATSACTPTTAKTPNQTYTCYDNNNTLGATQQYSIAKNANTPNCALSFKFSE